MKPDFLLGALELRGEDLAAMVTITVMFGTIIVAMLMKHQQRMAKILNGENASRNKEAEIIARMSAMEREMSELKGLLHQQILAQDRSVGLPPAAPTALEERLKQS